jgi:hypothetical protein
MIKKLVFVASPLSAQHQGERAKTGWLGIRIMWSDMSIHGLLFQWASTIKTQLSGPHEFILQSDHNNKITSITVLVLTKIYPLLPRSVQPISITKTLLIVPTKNQRYPPLFTGKLLIKFQNILRNTTQVIIRRRVKILFSVISSPITLEWCVFQNVLKFYQQLTGAERRIPFIFDNFHFCHSRVIGLDMMENRIFTLCRMITE